jgi:hypothetical protein
MIIGLNGEILKEIYQKTNCYIFVSDKLKQTTDERMLQLSAGSGPQTHSDEMSDEYNALPPIEKCKKEI